MGNLVKVSVIVPVYGAEKYLRACLDSLLSQTYSNFEIICINDCSPDGSAEILRQYKQLYPDRIVLAENARNYGPGRTKQHGLELASGEYVLFVDNDDYVRPDYIETYVDALNENDVDIIVGGYTRDVDGNLSPHYPSDSVWCVVTQASLSSKLFRKSFIDQHELRFSNITCGEDILFSLEAFYFDSKFKVIPYSGYFYRFNRDSITNTMSYEDGHEQFISNLYVELFANHDMSLLDEHRYRIIEYSYLANMVNSLVVFNRGCGIKTMGEKLRFIENDARSRFPDCLNNPLVGLFRPKGQTTKIRLGVGVSVLLAKVHLAHPFFYLISLV